MPKGTLLQFRYSREIVEPAVWSDPSKYEHQVGLVCSIDLSVMNRPCTLVPVRHVTIERIHRHGSTLSVLLRIGELAAVESLASFTDEVNNKSGGKVPSVRSKDDQNQGTDAKGSTGYFFFNAGEVGLVTAGLSLTMWEAITAHLYKQPKYKEEPFFWTVLALRRLDKPDTIVTRDTFVPWDERMMPGRDYSMVVYVFHPLRDKWDAKPYHLRLTSRPPMSTSYPLDQIIDSPYDTKEWRFRLEDPGLVGRSRGWFRLGPAISDSDDPRWEIDLPIVVTFSWGGFWVTTVLLGVLLSAPAMIGIWSKAEGRLVEEIVSSIGALAFGIAAALVAAWRIPKRV